MQHHTSCVYALALHNYPLVASSSDDKTIKLFSIKTHEVVLTLKGHQAYVRAIAILQDGKHLVSGSYDSTLKIWQLSDAVCQNTLTGHTKPVLVVCVLYNTDSCVLSGGEDATIKAWNWKQGTQMWRAEFDKNEVWSLLHVDNSHVISGHKDGFIRVVTQKDGLLQNDLRVHKSFINKIVKLP